MLVGTFWNFVQRNPKQTGKISLLLSDESGPKLFGVQDVRLSWQNTEAFDKVYGMTVWFSKVTKLSWPIKLHQQLNNLILAILQTWPFWDGENVTVSMVMKDLQLYKGIKRSRTESPGSLVFKITCMWKPFLFAKWQRPFLEGLWYTSPFF